MTSDAFYMASDRLISLKIQASKQKIGAPSGNVYLFLPLTRSDYILH